MLRLLLLLLSNKMEISETHLKVIFNIIREQNKRLLREIAIRENIKTGKYLFKDQQELLSTLEPAEGPSSEHSPAKT